jgi:hypothetical protein
MLHGRRARTSILYLRTPASRMKSHAFIRLFCVIAVTLAARAYETEHEPNNTLLQANALQCTDTVVCGVLTPVNDADYFSVHVFEGDSIVTMTMACSGSSTDTHLMLFDDQNSVCASDEDSGPELFSMIRYAAVRSGTYKIRVMRTPTSRDSTYNLIVQCPRWLPEAYDSCTSARVITALPYYDEGTTFGAHQENCGTPSPDVFYKFHNPAESEVYITVCSDLFDAHLQIWGRCCGDPGDDSEDGCGRGAALHLFRLPVGDYWIMVEGTTAAQQGNFSIEVTAHLSDCAKPDSIVLANIGGYPMLDWHELTGPTFYIVWIANYCQGPWEHLGTTTETFYIDSTGFVGSRKFYQVTSVCPW